MTKAAPGLMNQLVASALKYKAWKADKKNKLDTADEKPLVVE